MELKVGSLYIFSSLTNTLIFKVTGVYAESYWRCRRIYTSIRKPFTGDTFSLHKNSTYDNEIISNSKEITQEQVDLYKAIYG